VPLGWIVYLYYYINWFLCCKGANIMCPGLTSKGGKLETDFPAKTIVVSFYPWSSIFKHSLLFFSFLLYSIHSYTRSWNCFWNVGTIVSLTCRSFSSVWWLKEKNMLSVLESPKCLVMKCTRPGIHFTISLFPALSLSPSL
jgi:hypothetical protein